LPWQLESLSLNRTVYPYPLLINVNRRKLFLNVAAFSFGRKYFWRSNTNQNPVVKFSYSLFSLLIIALLVSVMSTSCASKRKKEVTVQQKGGGNKPPAPKVDVFVVKSETVSASLEIPGTLVADDATEIHPEVSGRITGLYIREGAYVDKGAVLARLYDGDLRAQKRKLEVQLKIAQQTAGRHEELVKIGGISKQDYDLSVLQVSNLRADLDIINTTLDKTVIRAPFSGKLGLKEISVGAYVTPLSVISSIQKTSGLKIDFNVPEKYTTQIKKGQYVNFRVEGIERPYTAVVSATESGIATETRSLMIRASVTGDATGLIPGNFAKVHLSFAPDNNALMVPTQAIIPQARGKKVVLYRNGIATFTDVTTGVRDSSMVQIVSGLNKGDTVVVTGLLSIKPEATITLKNIINKEG
jgi:membrane fusion protein, multidrug efflux system